ncbi:MAG: RecX family transcriptional regulator, partial [Chloroflexi bacterium]|nr:RecX family transcriptional regulator [Chloroflexota bacterium]
LDEKFAFGLATIIAARLKVGQTLGDEEIRRLRAMDEIEEAYNKSLNYLSYRPRSRAEIEKYLKDKKVSDEGRAQVLERLARAQFLDDEQFAQYWVENREQFAPRGKRALRSELRQKGISDVDAQAVLEDVDEQSSAYQAAQKRAARMAGMEGDLFYRRLSGFLARRGFGYDVVKAVVAKLWSEVNSNSGGSDELADE